MAKRDTLSSRKLKRYKELNIDNHYLRRIKRRELFSKFFHSSNFKYSKILTSILTPIFQFLSTSTNVIFDRVVFNFAIFLQPFPTYLNFRIFQILNYKYPERLIHNFPNHLIPRAEPVSAFLPGKAALLISIEHVRRSARIFRVRKISKFPLTERSGPTIYRNSKRSHLAYLRVKFCSLCHFRMKISSPRIIRGNISKVTAYISNWRRNSPTMERTALQLQSFKNRSTRVPD